MFSEVFIAFIGALLPIFGSLICVIFLIWRLFTKRAPGPWLNFFTYLSPVVISSIVPLFFYVLPPLIEGQLNGIHPKEIAGLPKLTQKAIDLHASLETITDLHADSLLWHRDLLTRSSRGTVDIPRLIAGNVAVQGFGIVSKVPLFMSMDNNTNTTDLITPLHFAYKVDSLTWSLKDRVIHQCKRLHEFEKNSGGTFRVIKTKVDLEEYLQHRNKSNKITAGFLAIEGAQAVENMDDLEEIVKAGVRMISPTHFFDTKLGGSAHGLSKGGLTEFGKKIIHRMEELNIIIDLAHSSPAVIDDVLSISTKTIAISHSGVKGTCASVRNLSDGHIKGIAARGGVIGIAYFPHAICGTTVKDITKAIRYVADLVGVDYIGLGSDYDGAVKVPFATDDLVYLTQGLIDENFTDEEIRKIMGGNVIRLLLKGLPSK